MRTVRIEEIIGLRISQARQTRHLSQTEFGLALGRYLAQSWTRQAVCTAEKGLRSFTAAEIFAIAAAIDCAPSDLFSLPDDVDGIQFPAARLSREQIQAAVTASPLSLDELRASADAIKDGIEYLRDLASDVEIAGNRCLEKVLSLLSDP